MATTVVPSVSGDEFPLVVPDNMTLQDFFVLLAILGLMAIIAGLVVRKE